MFKERSTEKLIEYIQTLPREERKVIAKNILEPKAKKKTDKKELKKQQVLNDIRDGLLEIKEAKRTGKKLKSLEEFLNEI